uniref:Uncharacterized protein n=1 Tax=viral metagenome TaxID=1070528 RepID=A0A6M3LX52_9ZZZZ
MEDFDIAVFLADQGFIQGQEDNMNKFERGDGYKITIINKKRLYFKKLMVIMLHFPDTRKHIATCLAPRNYYQANSLFTLFEIKNKNHGK